MAERAELSPLELKHFADHGWVLRKGVFSAAECAAMRAATDAEIQSARQQQGFEEVLGVRFPIGIPAPIGVLFGFSLDFA